MYIYNNIYIYTLSHVDCISTYLRELTLAPWLWFHVCVWAVGLLPDVDGRLVLDGLSLGGDQV